VRFRAAWLHLRTLYGFLLTAFRSMRVPFASEEHATTAKRALEVDREQNAEFVERTIEVQGDELIM
jgi:hypothetical protein